MNWGSLDNFLAMGGYGFYVWGSYGVTAALIAVELALLRARRRAAETTAERTVRAREERDRA
jgi:heme exporter protein D